MTQQASRLQALTLFVACAAVFVAGYQLTLRRALRLPDLPTSALPWDDWVPFWPASIVVYSSINLAYPLAFIVVRDAERLHALAARLLAVQLVCFACFTVWPMRMQRLPDAEASVWAPWFAALGTFDGASNLVPSLHVAILGVLWWHVRASVQPRAGRLGCDAWAAAVALSALTTWQHHLIDVLAGAAVAAAVVRGGLRDIAFLKERGT